MKKNNFRFEDISIPVKFLTVHKDEASFLKQGKKQFFRDKPEAEQEKLLKAMYKEGMELHKQNEAAEKATPAEETGKKYRDMVKKNNTNPLKEELQKRNIAFLENADAEALVQLLINDDAKTPAE